MSTETQHSWREIVFDKIVNDSAFGPRFPGTAYADDGNIATLRTTDISADGHISYDTMPLAQLDEAAFANHFLKPGDLVITRSGRIGTTAIFEGHDKLVLPGAFLIRFRLSEEANPRFFCYWFNSTLGQQRLLSVARGAAQQNINITNVKTLKVPLPPLQGQESIVSILSAYDDLIENNRRRIQLLEQAARLLYKEWFVHLRFPCHEHTKIIDGVPEGWERQDLGEIATILKGKNITKETIKEGNVPVVAGGLKPAYYHNEANTSGPVITVSASGANAGHVALYHKDIWASDCSYLSSADNPEIWFLYLLMKSRQSEITGMQLGAAQPHVYPKHLKRLGLLKPPRTLRKLFHETVEAGFLQIANLEKQIEKLAKARDLLLPKLMNGEVAV